MAPKKFAPKHVAKRVVEKKARKNPNCHFCLFMAASKRQSWMCAECGNRTLTPALVRAAKGMQVVSF